MDLTYLDQESGERYIPYVIEPAAGADRGTLAFLLDAYAEDEAPDAKGEPEKRTVLRLDPRLAPVKVAVLPLSRNADLSPKARDIAAMLRKRWTTEFDDARRSAAATAARTRSARRSASRSTSTPSTTRPSPSGTATRWPRSASASTPSRLPRRAPAYLVSKGRQGIRAQGGADRIPSRTRHPTQLVRPARHVRHSWSTRVACRVRWASRSFPIRTTSTDVGATAHERGLFGSRAAPNGTRS